MTGVDTSALLPGDVVAALRSLPPRYRRALDPDRLAEGDVDRRDDLVGRPGPSGVAPLDHLRDAARTAQLVGRALEDVAVQDEPVVHPAAVDASRRHWPAPAGEAVDDLLDELTTALVGLADHLEQLASDRWARTGRVAEVGPRSLLELARGLVATVADDLRLLDTDLRGGVG